MDAHKKYLKFARVGTGVSAMVFLTFGGVLMYRFMTVYSGSLQELIGPFREKLIGFCILSSFLYLIYSKRDREQVWGAFTIGALVLTVLIWWNLLVWAALLMSGHQPGAFFFGSSAKGAVSLMILMLLVGTWAAFVSYRHFSTFRDDE